MSQNLFPCMYRHFGTALALVGLFGTAHAATFNVESLIDDTAAGDIQPGDGQCADLFGVCTLRAAINEANELPGPDEIRFSVAGRWTAAADAGALPTITERLAITGFGAPGHNGGLHDIAASPPVIILDGSNLSGSADGLRFFGATASNSQIAALSLVHFPDNGIEIAMDANSFLIEGCFLGLEPNGQAAGNRRGISILNSHLHNIGSIYNFGGQNFIGLPNVVSANSEAGILASNSDGLRLNRNIIGATADLTAARGNAGVGIRISGDYARLGALDLNNNEFGGNIIVANQANGIELIGSNAELYGNFIGQTPAGTALGNSGDGLVYSGHSSSIGHMQSSAQNTFANNQHGLVLGFAGGAEASTVRIQNNRIGSATQGNLGIGIRLANAHDITISNNSVLNNSGGGIQVSGSDHRIVANRIGTRLNAGFWEAHANLGFAIRLENNSQGVALGAPGADANIIGNTLPFGMSAAAISAAGSGHRIEGNWIGIAPDGSAMNNVGAGIDANGSLFQIRANQIGNNTLGIQLAGSAHLVQNNQIGTDLYARDQGNLFDGIRASGSSHTIEANRIAWNGQHGIALSNSNQSAIATNLIAFNGLAGIAADSTNDLEISSNQLRGNVNGIQLSGASLRNRFFANRMFENTALAIDLNVDGTTGNDANDNDEGPNRLMNSPELSSAMIIDAGTSAPSINLNYRVNTSNLNANYPLRVALYWTDRDEVAQGRYFLSESSYTTPFSQTNLNVNLPAGTRGGALNAIACDQLDNCSELSSAQMFGSFELVFEDSLESL